MYQIVDICHYREWICLNINGVDKVFDLHSTTSSHFYSFYIYEDEYLFQDLIPKKIEKIK
jgi:hypothetical protein